MTNYCYICCKDQKNNETFVFQKNDNQNTNVILCDNCGKRILAFINSIKNYNFDIINGSKNNFTM